jgi:hypothetical protein
VTFHYFYGGTTTVTVWQKDLLGTKWVGHPAGTVTVAPGSATPVTFSTPGGITVLQGPVYVTTGSGMTSNQVNPVL